MYARKIWTYHTVLIVYVYGMHLQSSFFVVLKLFTGVEIQTSRKDRKVSIHFWTCKQSQQKYLVVEQSKFRVLIDSFINSRAAR